MTSKELIRILEKNGWVLKREGKGSHKIYEHPNKPGPLISVPYHGSQEMGKGIVNKILKQAGLK